MNSLRGKYPRIRWFALAQVIAVALFAPSEYVSMFRDHESPLLIVWVTALGIGWNGMLLKFWWATRSISKEDSMASLGNSN